MAIPLWTGKVGPGSEKPWMPTVETLAPYKAYAEGARLAKDLPSTGQAIVEGIQGAIDKNQAYRAKEAEIARVQAVTQAAEAEAKVRADQYAEAVRLQNQEQKLMEVMQTGTPEQKSEAFWSGQFVDIFGANPKLQESIFKTVIAPNLTEDAYKAYTGKTANSQLENMRAREIFKLDAEKGKAQQSLISNPIYNDNIDSFKTPGELIAEVTATKQYPLGAIATNPDGTVQRKPNGEPILIDTSLGDTPLPPGFTDSDKRNYATTIIGNKVKHVLIEDLNKFKKAANTMLLPTPGFDQGPSDVYSRNQRLLYDANKDREQAKVAQKLEIAQQEEQAVKELPKAQIAPGTNINAQEIVSYGAVKSEGDTGVIVKDRLKDYAVARMQLTDEQAKQYGDEIASLLEADALYDSVFYSPMKSLVMGDVRPDNSAKVMKVVSELAEQNYENEVAKRKREYEAGVKKRLETEKATGVTIDKEAPIELPGMSQLPTGIRGSVEFRTELSRKLYLQTETQRLIDRLTLLSRNTKVAISSSDSLSKAATKANTQTTVTSAISKHE